MKMKRGIIVKKKKKGERIFSPMDNSSNFYSCICFGDQCIFI